MHMKWKEPGRVFEKLLGLSFVERETRKNLPDIPKGEAP